MESKDSKSKYKHTDNKNKSQNQHGKNNIQSETRNENENAKTRSAQKGTRKLDFPLNSNIKVYDFHIFYSNLLGFFGRFSGPLEPQTRSKM